MAALKEADPNAQAAYDEIASTLGTLFLGQDKGPNRSPGLLQFAPALGILAGPGKQLYHSLAPKVARALERIVPIVNVKKGDFNPLTYAQTGDKRDFFAGMRRNPALFEKRDLVDAVDNLDPHEWMITLNEKAGPKATAPSTLIHEGLHALYRHKTLNDPSIPGRSGMFPSHDPDVLSKMLAHYYGRIPEEQFTESIATYPYASGNRDVLRKVERGGRTMTDTRHMIIDLMSRFMAENQRNERIKALTPPSP